MVSNIETFRHRGIEDIALGAIHLYQTQISTRTRAKCRFSPSCSNYAKQAIKLHGIIDGLLLFWTRYRKCNPKYKGKNCGFDPVPVFLQSGKIQTQSSTNVTRNDLKTTQYEQVARRTTDFRPEYDYRFKLIMTYPLGRQFYDKVDLKVKIAEFNSYVLQVEQYAIMFAVDIVEAGTAKGVYLLRVQGTFSGEYLETKIDEVVQLLILQFENFFDIMQKGELKPVYFEIDGQVVYQPPSDVIPQENAWERTSDRTFWDDYWDSYVISDLVELAANILQGLAENADYVTVDLPEAADNTVFADPPILSPLGIDPTPPGDLSVPDGGLDLNPFDGDGFSLPDVNTDGCGDIDLNLFDGCDPGGCDGCGDGCDLGGCSS
jgi:uncharacterized protein